MVLVGAVGGEGEGESDARRDICCMSRTAACLLPGGLLLSLPVAPPTTTSLLSSPPPACPPPPCRPPPRSSSCARMLSNPSSTSSESEGGWCCLHSPHFSQCPPRTTTTFLSLAPAIEGRDTRHSLRGRPQQENSAVHRKKAKQRAVTNLEKAASMVHGERASDAWSDVQKSRHQRWAATSSSTDRQKALERKEMDNQTKPSWLLLPLKLLFLLQRLFLLSPVPTRNNKHRGPVPTRNSPTPSMGRGLVEASESPPICFCTALCCAAF